MLTHGLLICSFNLKKKYSRDELISLNKPYTYDDIEYRTVFDLLGNFCEHFSSLTDNEKMMKLFAVDKESVHIIRKKDCCIMNLTVQSGAYGVESEMTDRNTKKVVYRRNKEDADIKRFHMHIYVPNDYDDFDVVKGIFIFETIGTYGVKTITTQNMKTYFSEKFGITLETRSISVRIFMEKLLKDEKLNRVTLIKNNVSKDPADNMFLSTGRHEEVYIRPKLQHEWIRKLLEFLDGKNQNDIFEVKDEKVDDIKLTFSHNGKTKTVRINDIDKFSMVEDLPSYIYNGNNVDVEKLYNYMEETSFSYSKRMIMIRT